MLVKDFSTKPIFLTFGNSPKWSPDGKKIAYLLPKSQSLYVIDFATGGNRTFIAEKIDNFEWSPDSKKIFFSRSGKS